MTVLFTADLHQTDRPKDRYRFDFWDWLRKQQRKANVEATFILGDLTDAKDKHSSRLVNRIVDGLKQLEPPVFVLCGNHDYIDPATPFFRFLNAMDGVSFIREPKCYDHPWGRVLCIPHQAHGWPDLGWMKGRPDYVLIHQCVEGAIAESGARLNGLETATIERLGAKRVLAGDIHRPQQVGPVAYVGAPYHIRFGDGFTPRCILLDPKKDKVTDIHFPAPRKLSLTIRDSNEIEGQVEQGDHVKITVDLTREEVVDWQKIKRSVLNECDRIGLEVYGCDMKVKRTTEKAKVDYKAIALKSPKQVLVDFSNHEKLSSAQRREGEQLLEG